MAWSETTREKYNRSSERYESDLTDEEWLLIEPLLPPPSKLGRRRTADLREICNAIHYMLATGCQWRPGRRGRCRAPPPTEPDVPALEHPVPRMSGSLRKRRSTA